jgi:hypothetical protein
MTNHLTLRIGNKDSYSPGKLPGGDNQVVASLERTIGSGRIANNLWKVIRHFRLNPSREAIDLCYVATAVFVADKTFPRSQASDSWARDIHLYLPVSDVTKWTSARETLVTLLEFLTGDHWTIDFRASLLIHKQTKKETTKENDSAVSVSLFSGGLDSFIGAYELIQANRSCYFVGHYEEGVTSSAQCSAFDCIQKITENNASPLLQFYIRPPANEKIGHESSTRSRSFLFYSLGTLVASSLGKQARLSVPENGFIGLNPPLSITRLGSLSTRTAHPYTVHLFSGILEALGINIPIETPYEFMTKGQMIIRVGKNKAFIKCFAKTLSCAHSSAGRYHGWSPKQHCGYCLPCLIRRAAFNKAGLDPVEKYSVDVLSSLPPGHMVADVRACLLAIERSKTTAAIIPVMATGPLSFRSSDIPKFIKVYQEGLRELAVFLKKRSW